MSQSRPLFVYCCPFLITISIIQIEKSLDGVLGIQTRECRMVGSDETTEQWQPLYINCLLQRVHWTDLAFPSCSGFLFDERELPSAAHQQQRQWRWRRGEQEEKERVRHSNLGNRHSLSTSSLIIVCGLWPGTYLSLLLLDFSFDLCIFNSHHRDIPTAFILCNYDKFPYSSRPSIWRLFELF